MELRHEVAIARFGRIWDRMITQAHFIAGYALGETIQDRAKCLAFDRNHGTWMGSGTVRGVALTTIPEGALGPVFNGSGFVRVPNDGSGFVLPDDAGGRTMSGAGGDFDVYGLLVATNNDATHRCICHKQETDENGNGWKVFFENGQLGAAAIVGGSPLVDFARDLPLDGREYFWQWHFSPSTGISRLILNGLPMGADESIAATELGLNAGDFQIARFNGGNGGFLGTIALVGLSREGNPDICAALHQARTWTAITPDIRCESAPVTARHGSTDTSPLALTASPGAMTLDLDNSSLNEAGKEGCFAPGHPDAMVGFEEGNPIRWIVYDGDGVPHVRFRGFISEIEPVPGLARSHLTHVVAETWLARAMRLRVGLLPVQVSLRTDDALRYLLDQADRPPVAIDFAVADSTFPIVFDDLDAATPIYQEAARLTLNEGGRLLERVDGTLVFESRSARYLTLTPVAAWTEFELQDLDAKRSRVDVINAVPTTIRPSKAGAVTTDELASMPARIAIPPGASMTFELSYSDPSQPVAKVGGVDLVTPVAVTDYTMFEAEDGTGLNLTAFASVSLPDATRGGTSAQVAVLNTHHVLVGYFVTRLRGRKLTRFGERTHDFRDDESINRHDRRELPLTLDYQSSLDEAEAIARQIIALRKEPFMAPRTAIRRGMDDGMIADILDRDMGDLVSVQESVAALDGSERTFIDGVEFTAGALDQLPLLASYTINRAPAARSFWILDEPGFAELDETMVFA